MSKLNWKSIVGWGIAALVAGFIVYTNMQEQKKSSNENTVLVILPMTGNAAVWGQHFSKGVDYFKNQNPNANINVKIVDSQSNPMQTISALQQELAIQKPFAVIATISSIAVPASKFASEAGVPAIACVVSDKTLEAKNVQRIFPSAFDNIKPVADIAKKKYKRLAILYGNDESGVACKKVMENEYKAPDNEIVFMEAYDIGKTDVRNLVYKTLSKNPDAVFIAGLGLEYWEIIRLIKSSDFKGDVLSDLAFSDATQRASLEKAAEGVIYTTSRVELSDNNNPKVENLREFYKNRYNALPNYTGVIMYEALSVLNEMSKKGLSPNREQLLKLGKYDGLSGTLEFLPNGDMHYPWIAVTLKDGKIVPVEE